jgi:hypothetical protein
MPSRCCLYAEFIMQGCDRKRFSCTVRFYPQWIIFPRGEWLSRTQPPLSLSLGQPRQRSLSCPCGPDLILVLLGLFLAPHIGSLLIDQDLVHRQAESPQLKA